MPLVVRLTASNYRLRERSPRHTPQSERARILRRPTAFERRLAARFSTPAWQPSPAYIPAPCWRTSVRIDDPVYHACKRALDLAVCLVLLPLVLPLIVTCGMLVKLESRGPMFFVQWRTGKGGRRFRMYKLRTMVANAEELKQKYLHLNEQTGPDFKIKNDPRITRIGRFLRKTSLDELPQIFNVLLGQMSLVGPRPTSFGAETYELWHTERLEVKPGITGLWQISGRSDLDFDERLRLDIAYIERRSFWYDLYIILMTVPALFIQRNAY